MTGIFPRKQEGLKTFSRKRNKGCVIIILALLLAPFIQEDAGAQTIEPVSRWTMGSSWEVRAIYRQLNGDWSDPVLWTFTVVTEEEETCQVRVKSEESPGQALLDFEKRSGQLKHITLTDTFRGEVMVREIRINTLSPVYPSFSAIPFHVPFFLYSSPEDDFCLERLLNGRSIGSETLHQAVEPVSRNQWSILLPKEAGDEWEAYDSEGILFAIQKGDRPVFRQIWFQDLPWAIYTESKDIRAWLRRESP